MPYWDFEAPEHPERTADTSAAAIAASGCSSWRGWRPTRAARAATPEAAKDTLASLSSSAYLAEGTTSDAILLHATQNEPDGASDTGLIYGDYYFIEALLRYRSLAGTITDSRDRAPDRRRHRRVRRRLHTVPGRRAVPARRDRGR